MSRFTGFGGFIAEVRAAEAAGYRWVPCPHCGLPDWLLPGEGCSHRACELRRALSALKELAATGNVYALARVREVEPGWSPEVT